MKFRAARECAAKVLIASASVAAFAQSAVAQTPPPPPDLPTNPGSGSNLVSFLFKKSPYEFWLTLLIIAFGLTVLGFYIYAIRNIRDRRPEDVSRALIVITVITGSLVLITAGYSNEQIAPAFGLFGTIIGYMLGRMSQSAPGGSAANPRPSADPKDEETK